MTQSRGSILIALFVIGAFLYGYNKDRLLGGEEKEPAKVVKTEPKPAAPAQPAAGPPPPPPPVEFSKSAPPPIVEPEAPPPVPASEGPQPPPNPYIQFMKSFGGRDSAQQPAPSDNGAGSGDQQVVRRNAYFEKLSQQLKELRGEQPPPAPPGNVEQPPAGEVPGDTAADPQALPEAGFNPEPPGFDSQQLNEGELQDQYGDELQPQGDYQDELLLDDGEPVPEELVEPQELQ